VRRESDGRNGRRRFVLIHEMRVRNALARG
jgi:hypothetical protein